MCATGNTDLAKANRPQIINNFGSGANADTFTVDVATASVPEPASLVLLGTGLLGTGLLGSAWSRAAARPRSPAIRGTRPIALLGVWLIGIGTVWQRGVMGTAPILRA